MRDLAALRSFVAVVDNGSIVDAARVCGYSAPAVSRHIGALERELGVTLFERTGRSVRPSVAARALAERARLLLEEAEQFDREARALATGDIGVIRLAYFRAAGATIVPRALAVLEALRPGAKVLLIECELSEDVEALLRSRDADLGFVWGFPEPQPTDLVTSLLFRESLVLMTSVDRDDLHEQPHDLSRLTGEVFASAPGHRGAPPIVDRLFESRGLPRPTVTHRPTDHAMLRSLVMAGVVINLIPALGVSDIAPGVRRSVAVPDFRRTYLSWADASVNPLVAAMVRAVRIAGAEFSGFGVDYVG